MVITGAFVGAVGDLVVGAAVVGDLVGELVGAVGDFVGALVGDFVGEGVNEFWMYKQVITCALLQLSAPLPIKVELVEGVNPSAPEKEPEELAQLLHDSPGEKAPDVVHPVQMVGAVVTPALKKEEDKAAVGPDSILSHVESITVPDKE